MFQVNAPSFASLLGNHKIKVERESLGIKGGALAGGGRPGSQYHVAANSPPGIAQVPSLL